MAQAVRVQLRAPLCHSPFFNILIQLLLKRDVEIDPFWNYF